MEQKRGKTEIETGIQNRIENKTYTKATGPASQKASPAQECAIHHAEGPMLVLAGPGSGKTFVVTQRIKALIEEHGAQPSRILVITFTKAAAQEMKERFANLTGNRYPVQFGTFHAFFYQILKQSSYQRDIRILSEAQKMNYVHTAIWRSGSQVKPAEEFAEVFLREVSRMKNSIGPWQEFEPSGCDRELFYRIFSAYEEQKQTQGGLDFDDIVQNCWKLLSEQPLLGRKWQERFDYILVDEFQDINEIQYRIVRLLTQGRQNLFAVGDDDQSIYGFRGASPDRMKQFLRDYTECRRVTLCENYRSVEPVVRAAGQIIEANRNRMPKQIRAVRKAALGEAVRIKVFESREEEYRFLVQELGALSGKEQNNTAVIFRTNRDLACFAPWLQRAEIPFVMREKVKSIFRHFIAQEVMACLRFAGGECGRNLFYRFMNHPYRGIPRELLTEPEVNLERLAGELRSGRECGFAYRQVCKLAGDLERLRLLRPYAGLLYLCRGMGYEKDLKKRLQEKEREEDTEILYEILESARGMESLSKWQEEIEQYEQRLERENEHKESRTAQDGAGVRLLTLHAAKGLEYNRVYLPHLNEGVLPHRKSVAGQNGGLGVDTIQVLEEECRMLYVGMTRARDSLCLSYLSGTKEKPEQVSRFLRPLL